MIFKSLSFLVISSLLLSSCGNSGEKKDELNAKSSDGSSFEGAQATNASGANSLSSASTEGYSVSIKLAPFIPAYPELGESGKQLLVSRLNAAVSKIGFGGDGANPRFIIGPSINLLSKNVTGTAPTKYANTYEVNLMTCDVVTETIFQSYTFQVKGVGDSPEKAFINGFRDYRFDNEEFYKFLVESEKKILAFYNKNCNLFMQEADAQAKIRNYDAAFTILNNIPMEAEQCYSTAATKKSEYFQMSLNMNCQTVLASMKAEMGKANDASASGFNEAAMSFYSMIDRQSSCFPEAEKIYQAYLKKLNPKAKRDWDFEMKKYQDQIDRVNKLDQFNQDSVSMNFDYLKHKDEMQTKAEVEGNKKLLQKYQYDELPWIRKIFHLGKYDPFDRIEK